VFNYNVHQFNQSEIIASTIFKFIIKAYKLFVHVKVLSIHKLK